MAASYNLSSRNPLPRRYIQAGFYFALGVVLLALLAWFVRRFALATLAVLTPFAIGLVLALLLDPLADRLMRLRLGRWQVSRTAAAGLVFLVFVLLIFGVAWLTVPALIAQAASLAQNGPTFIDGLRVRANDFLLAHHKIGPITLPKNFAQLTDEASGQVSGVLQKAGGGVMVFLIGSATVVVQMVLALIIGFYLLVDIDRFRARLLFLAPQRWRGMIAQVSGDVGGVFSDYLRGLLIVCSLYGVSTILMLYGLSLFHHSLAQYALLVGAAAGVLYAVPYLGSSATALVTFIVAFAAATGDGNSGLVFGGIAVGATLVLNQIFDNIVTPRVVGGGVGLHPVLALFALVIGGELFGITGMLLSVPIAGSIQAIVFRLYPRLTRPTPSPFLAAQGVPLGTEESSKILEGDDSVTAKREKSEQRENSEKQANSEKQEDAEKAAP